MCQGRRTHHLRAKDFWSTEAVAEFNPLMDEVQEHDVVKPPTLPFRASFHHVVSDSHVAVRAHLCRADEGPVRGIAFFLPGLWGGMGPGRAPGQNSDNDAIFPTVARKLTREMKMPIDCYRLSWSESSPSMDFAAQCVLSMLRVAHQKALRQDRSDDQDIRFYLVGHSYGGAVAFEAALRAGEQQWHTAGTPPRLAGICLLNTVLVKEQLPMSTDDISCLSKVRSLLVLGDADACPGFTMYLHSNLPEESGELRVLPDGTHGLFAHRDTVSSAVSHFIAKDLLDSTDSPP